MPRRKWWSSLLRFPGPSMYETDNRRFFCWFFRTVEIELTQRVLCVTWAVGHVCDGCNHVFKNAGELEVTSKGIPFSWEWFGFLWIEACEALSFIDHIDHNRRRLHGQIRIGLFQWLSGKGTDQEREYEIRVYPPWKFPIGYVHVSLRNNAHED